MKERVQPKRFNRKLPHEGTEETESQFLHFSCNKIANLQVFSYGIFEGR